jgi:hypothetical protein
MIKVLKLQKAVISIILGLLSLIVYFLIREQQNEVAIYFLEVAGFLFMLGALLFLYPILFAKKDQSGAVELDPSIDPESESGSSKPHTDQA